MNIFEQSLEQTKQKQLQSATIATNRLYNCKSSNKCNFVAIAATFTQLSSRPISECECHNNKKPPKKKKNTAVSK